MIGIEAIGLHRQLYGSFYAIFRYSGSCAVFGLEVPMRKKYLTYDGRLAIRAGTGRWRKTARGKPNKKHTKNT